MNLERVSTPAPPRAIAKAIRLNLIQIISLMFFPMPSTLVNGSPSPHEWTCP